MKLLLDTNVLIDIFARREGHYSDAAMLMVTSIFGDTELWVSAKSYTDIFYILVKHGYDPGRLQAAFERSLDHLHVCSVDQDDILLASQSRWGDFEDCIIAENARKIRADMIITRDKTGFDRSLIPFMSPRSFLAYMESEFGVVYDEIDLK